MRFGDTRRGTPRDDALIWRTGGGPALVPRLELRPSLCALPALPVLLMDAAESVEETLESGGRARSALLPDGEQMVDSDTVLADPVERRGASNAGVDPCARRCASISMCRGCVRCQVGMGYARLRGVAPVGSSIAIPVRKPAVLLSISETRSCAASCASAAVLKSSLCCCQFCAQRLNSL